MAKIEPFEPHLNEYGHMQKNRGIRVVSGVAAFYSIEEMVQIMKQTGFIQFSYR